MSKNIIDKLVTKTVNGGAQIVELLKEGSAFYAPAAAMAEAIIKDTGIVIPVSTYLEGEYGFKDVCLGVPVSLGKNGVEKIIELELTPGQRISLLYSKEAVTEGIEQLK